MACAHHPVFARLYVPVSRALERDVRHHRDQLTRGLRGRVIEIGAGNGLNFTHYPHEVTGVVAVEPEPYLRRHAQRAAVRTPITIEVIDGVAEDLPAEDASFDAAVASLVLCTVTDPAAALAELFRVVRPGGRLHFYEHVRGDTPGLRRAQRVADATFWPRVAGGCHSHRDTAAAIAGAGFSIDRLDRFRFPDTRVPVPLAPHILGSATRPPRPADDDAA